MERLSAYVLVAAAALGLFGLIRLGRRLRRRHRQVQYEDMLKQVCSARQEGRAATVSEIGGRLGLAPKATLALVQELEAAGFLRSAGGVLEPTEKGERLGLQVLRAHRFWERYLSDEAQEPLERLHDLAERAEHRLGADQIEALADHLGHPRERTPLTDWPRGRPAVVVHVEDEPGEGLREALRAGLYPGTVLRIVEKGTREITVDTGEGPHGIAPAVAAQIEVRDAPEGEEPGAAPATLAGLRIGGEAEVTGLRKGCSGLMRRRLLDLGFTPGTRIVAVLSNAGDEAHAYRIRDTLIALRQEQAEQVLIGPLGSGEGPEQPDGRAMP
jgi:DtxR family Mn-dependent transcriptional regulator